DINACLDSEQKARDQIVKDLSTYSSADKKQCMRTHVYLPSYVEWLTCLEMERDVRKMERQPVLGQFGAGPWTLPKVNPTINSGLGGVPKTSRHCERCFPQLGRRRGRSPLFWPPAASGPAAAAPPSAAITSRRPIVTGMWPSRARAG